MWNTKINDKDITIMKNTLELNESIEENNNAHFTFKNNEYLEIKPNYRVDITKQNKSKFNGYINTINQTFSYGADLTADVDCIGQDYLLIKRTITKGFSEQKVEDIVKWMIDNILSQEGVTAGVINAPVVIQKIAFDGFTCMEALDQLIMFGDYVWNITNDKKINFHTISENIAPYELDFTKPDCIALGSQYQIEQNYGNYRNTVILKGAKGLSPREEIFRCDGNATSWNLKMNVGVMRTIQVDRKDGRGWVSCTFAPNTEENSKGQYMFLYDEGGNQITQYIDQEKTNKEDGTNEDILKEKWLIRVDYLGEYELRLRYSNYGEVEIQKNVDSTSGINEVVEDVKIKGLANALQYVRNNIERNKKQGYRLSFKTDKELKTLQYIKVILPQLNINEYFLITSISEYEDNNMFYDVSIISGSIKDSFLAELFGDRQAYTTDLQSSQNQETANISMTFEKVWGESESPNMFNSFLFPSDNLYPAENLYPCLPETERLQYIQLYKKTNPNVLEPFLRAPIIGDEISDNGNIYLSTAMLDESISFDSECVSIGWIASDGYNPCTATDFTSGIEIVRADVETPFTKIKDLEFITIFRIDTKWNDEEVAG